MAEYSVYRTENKYILKLSQANSISSKLKLVLKKDSNLISNRYMVRSLYFDSINNKDFNTKLAGVENRKKIRIRVYDPSDTICKLEVKEKYGDLQHKISLEITKEDAIALIRCEYHVLTKYFDEQEDAVKIYTMMVMGHYKPVVMIEYDRIPYVYPANDLRVTFDMNIRASETNFNLFDQHIMYNTIVNDAAVLEVKYNNRLIKTVSDILRPYHLTKVAVSKYCMGRKVFYDFNY